MVDALSTENNTRRCRECLLASVSVHTIKKLANTRYLPFLAKSDRVLPVIATLLSFHSFLAILCSFPVGNSTTRIDQHGPQEQLKAKFRPGDVEVDNFFSFFL